MLITLLSIIADLALGAAAYKLSRSNQRAHESNAKLLVAHENRITALETAV